MNRLLVMAACFGLVALPATLVPTSAQAQVGEMPGTFPTARAERPLTLPGGMLRIDANLGVTRLSLGLLSATSLRLSVGAGYGITDDIELGVSLPSLNFQIDPEFKFGVGNPEILGIFRFLSGDVELAGTVAVRIPIENDFLAFRLGLAALLRFGGNIRLDTGLFFELNVYTSGTPAPDPNVGLYLPLRLSFSMTENIFFGVNTGFNVLDLTNAGDTIAVPLGLFVGYTIAPADTPVADLSLGFLFPQFFTTTGQDNPFTDLWSIGINANIYLDLN